MSYTNNDSKVIAGCYIETVTELGGCPRDTRTDMGTESMQCYLSETGIQRGINNEHYLPPFLYGVSHANQRIESWWSILRNITLSFG